MAHGLKVAIAHITRQRKILLKGPAILVLACPRLDRVELGGRVVENVGVDYGNESEKRRGRR
jgi:hypothetical protein